MIDRKTSFTSADAIPIKILLNDYLLGTIKNQKKIPPIHIQFLPTNKCNLNCSFCSCSERTKELEIDFELAKNIIDKCHKLGTRAVTITGGGEPLLYNKFNDLIDYFISKNIRIGLVTNGLALKKADFDLLDKITWCRISNGDERRFSDKYREDLIKVIHNTPRVDWAFSHVVSTKPNFEEIGKIITFANSHNFTHVRLVADLFTPEEVNMYPIKSYLLTNNIDDSKVIYQNRKKYTEGNDCYIGFLKPLIGADAKVYLCCGVQYALEVPSKDLPEELCLGNAIDIDKIYERSNIPANGYKCVKCYYGEYNNILNNLLKDIEHKEFL